MIGIKELMNKAKSSVNPKNVVFDMVSASLPKDVQIEKIKITICGKLTSVEIDGRPFAEKNLINEKFRFMLIKNLLTYTKLKTYEFIDVIMTMATRDVDIIIYYKDLQNKAQQHKLKL